MAKVLLVQAPVTTATLTESTANTGFWFAIAGQSSGWNTESHAQTKFYVAGTFSDLKVHISANTWVGTGTLCTRKGAVSQNLTVSFAAAATGWFEDTTHTDTIANADLWNWQLTSNNTSANTITQDTFHLTLAATTNTMIKFCIASPPALSTTTDQFLCPNTGGTPSSEANAQWKFRGAGTVANLFVTAITNTNSGGSTTVKSRKSGANGNLTLSVAASTTGSFEDTTHSDTLAAADLYCFDMISALNNGSVQFRPIAAEHTSTDSTWSSIAGGGANTVAAAATVYIPPGSRFGSFQTTETNAQEKLPFAYTASNLAVHAVTNATGTNGSCTLRQNAGATSLTCTITAATTGIFEDTTHTVSLAIADLVAIQVVNGDGATSFSIGAAGILGTTTTPASTTYPELERTIRGVSRGVCTGAY